MGGGRKVRLLIGAIALGTGVIAIWVAGLHGPTDSPPAVADAESPLHAEINSLREEAIGVVESLKEDFPASSDPLVLLGNLHNGLGNSAEAVRCWQQSLEMDPGRADAYRGLGSIAMRRGEHQQALDFWRKALEIKPRMTAVRTFSARALMALGRHEEAVEALKKDIGISPGASTSYFELGQAYRQLKEFQKAKRNYLTALRLQPDYTNACYALAVVCQRLGENDESGAYMERFKKLKAEDRLVDEDQRSVYDDAASARRSVAQTLTEAGQVYFGHGRTRQAEQHWQKAARLDPKNTSCRMQLVNVYMQENRDREALDICQELSRIDPEDPTTYLNIGVLNARLNRFDAALAAIQRAAALDPGNPQHERARRLIQQRRQRDGFGG